MVDDGCGMRFLDFGCGEGRFMEEGVQTGVGFIAFVVGDR